jgi:hypothetical protein
MVLGLWGNLPLGGRQAIAVMAAVVGLLALYEIIGRGHRLPPHRRRWAWLFVGLAFGGMLGNLGERALHWGVTDYLSFAWGSIWLPPGNVADLALLASMPLALVVIVFELQARAQRRPAGAVRDPRLFQRLIRPPLIRLRRLAGARGGRLSSPRTRTPPEN